MHHLRPPHRCVLAPMFKRIGDFLTPNMPTGTLRVHAGVEFVLRNPGNSIFSGRDWTSDSRPSPKYERSRMSRPYKPRPPFFKR